MTAFTQAFIALGYLSLAAGLGIALPQVAGFDPGGAVAVGALVAFAGLFAQHVALRAGREETLSGELRAMRRAQAEAMEELNAQVAAMRRLEDELAELRSKPAANAEMQAEVRVLQTLVHQLVDAGALPKGARSSPAAGNRSATTGAVARGARPDWAPPPTWTQDSGDDAIEAIRDAVANNRIDIYLQPVVRLPQRKAAYYEALSRLRAADGRLIEPRLYVETAERHGLIGAIDNSLLFRCVQLVRRTERKRNDVAFFCNVSGHTLADKDFFPQFIEFVEENDQLSDRLILEFPLDSFLAQTGDTEANLARLAALGFRFSVDHVRSFDVPARQLAGRAVAFVKMDAQTVLQKLRDPGGAVEARRLRTQLSIAGITLVVDRIEQEADVIELLDLPVEFGQGFRFGEPRLARDSL